MREGIIPSNFIIKCIYLRIYPAIVSITKAKCKVKIRKNDKIDDACWGFKTIKRKISDKLKHSTLSYDGMDVEIFADPSCPEDEVWIGLEELDTGEFLLGVFYLPQGKLIGGYNI